MKTWQRLKLDPLLRERFLKRELLIDSLRQYFKDLNFHEVDTPILVKHPGTEPNLEVFSTSFSPSNYSGQTGFLITSPEYSLKKLLSAGFGNLFQITKVFRNQEVVSPFHNPEFTLIEWYRVKANYINVMTDCEKLFIYLVKALFPDQDLTAFAYQDQVFDLTPPWPRFRLPDVFLSYTQINPSTLVSKSKLLRIAKHQGYQVSPDTTWEEIFYQIYFNQIEPELKKFHRPYFIYDYPLAQAALAKRSTKDPRFSERFEWYLGGIELGNCYSELTDVGEQNQRLDHDLKARQNLHKIAYEKDADFILALESGLPATAGIAVGVDRLIMLLLNLPTIQDTLLFPMEDIFNIR